MTEIILRSVLLGVGLAMDAFSVSVADGLAEPGMRKRRAFIIAGTFAVFQFAMPMIGWLLVRTAVGAFSALEKFIPWIALILLVYIGDKMLIEGIRARRQMAPGGGTQAASQGDASPGSEMMSRPQYDSQDADAAGSEITDSLAYHDSAGALTLKDLFMQGIATSIDALSVGFTIEGYALGTAFTSSAIIGIVTLAICLAGLGLGRSIGGRLAGRAEIIGGTILIAIGLEIWARGIL